MVTLANELGDVVGGDEHLEGVVDCLFLFIEVDLDQIDDHN